MSNEEVNLRVRIGTLVLENPVMVASGTFGWGTELEALDGFDVDLLGAIVLKGTTLNPREGNPTPRIVETASGMLNSIGLENPGVERVVEEYLPRLADCKAKVIANVAGETVEEYAEVTHRFDAADRIDAIELNISCPNTEKGGIFFGTSPELTHEVVAACRQATRKPLIVKLTPNVTDISEIAVAAVEARADAISLINTLRGMAIDIETRSAVLGNVHGGLSGPAIKPVGLFKVHEVYETLYSKGGLDVPIIGIGGISNIRDALEYMIAGATAFQLGTVLFTDPLAPMRIIEELPRMVLKLGERDINRLVGSLRMKGTEE